MPVLSLPKCTVVVILCRLVYLRIDVSWLQPSLIEFHLGIGRGEQEEGGGPRRAGGDSCSQEGQEDQ